MPTTLERKLISGGPPSAEPDRFAELETYAQRQRQRGEEAIAVNRNYKQMRGVVAELNGALTTAAPYAPPPTEYADSQFYQEALSRALGNRRQAIADALAPVVERFEQAERDLLDTYAKTALPTVQDVKPTAQQAATLAVQLAQVLVLDPAAFLDLCWSVIAATDVVTAAALYPVARSFKRDARYQDFTSQSPLGKGDPLADAIRGFELVLTTWEHHAARIARKIVPILHEEMRLVASQVLATGEPWVEKYPARADGRSAVVPHLDVPGREPNGFAPPLDDPELYEFGPSVPVVVR
jgi:hypothetical protein